MKPIKILPSGVQVLKTFTRFGMTLELHCYLDHYSIHFANPNLKTRNGNINHPITYRLAQFIYSKSTHAKLIEYAYPTSTHATQKGFGDTGCWFIAIHKHVTSWEIIQVLDEHFTNKDKALEYANTLPYPFHYAHKYFNQ